MDYIKENRMTVTDHVAYKGKPLLSYTLFGLIIVLMIYGAISNIHVVGNLVWFIILGFVSFFFIAWYAYYFELSDKSIVIRNHFMLWTKKEFLLNDITELKFEAKEKVPSGIRIKTQYETSRLFQSGVISNSDWIDLKKQLENRNVPINDEFVYHIIIFEFVLFKEIKELFSRNKK